MTHRAFLQHVKSSGILTCRRHLATNAVHDGNRALLRNALNAFICHGDEQKVEEGLSRPGNSGLIERPIAIKDNICTVDYPTTAASEILCGYTPPFDATVVSHLKDVGAYICGKTNMDEFGMGSYSLHSNVGPVKNLNHDGIPASAGGSSGGSAVAVARDMCWVALGTDTGGSIRTPAALTGIFGFKPSYGMISRWGVIPYANSLDTVGILATSVSRIRDTLGTISQHDPKDPTSVPTTTRDRLRALTLTYGRHLYTQNGVSRGFRRPLRIGLFSECNIAELSTPVRTAWRQLARELEAKGHDVVSISIPSAQQALAAYYVIATAEASSNLAKYDGVRYGQRMEGPDADPQHVLYARTRGELLGAEVKKRILLGSYSLSADAMDNYFIQAQRVRRLVQKDFNKVFSLRNGLLDEDNQMLKDTDDTQGVDIIIAPTAPMLAPTFEEIENLDPVREYVNDVFTVPASLAGLPAISIPFLVDRSVVTESQMESTGKNDKNVLEFATQIDEQNVLDRQTTKASLEGASADPSSSDAHLKDKIPIGLQIIAQYGHDELVLDVAEMLERLGLLASSTTENKRSPLMARYKPLRGPSFSSGSRSRNRSPPFPSWSRGRTGQRYD